MCVCVCMCVCEREQLRHKIFHVEHLTKHNDNHHYPFGNTTKIASVKQVPVHLMSVCLYTMVLVAVYAVKSKTLSVILNV